MNYKSLASELTAAGICGTHDHDSRGRLCAYIVFDGTHDGLSLKKFGLTKIWLEGHPSGECPDQIIWVKHKDGRKAYYNPDDDNFGCRWVDDFEAECKKCGSNLNNLGRDFLPVRGGGYCTNKECVFNKKFQHE